VGIKEKERELDSSGPGQGTEAASCEQGNESSFHNKWGT